LGFAAVREVFSSYSEIAPFTASHRANPREPDQQHQEACLGFGDDVTKLRHVPWFWLLSD
jgi:hypothetical protein